MKTEATITDVINRLKLMGYNEAATRLSDYLKDQGTIQATALWFRPSEYYGRNLRT